MRSSTVMPRAKCINAATHYLSNNKTVSCQVGARYLRVVLTGLCLCRRSRCRKTPGAWRTGRSSRRVARTCRWCATTSTRWPCCSSTSPRSSPTSAAWAPARSRPRRTRCSPTERFSKRYKNQAIQFNRSRTSVECV